jgi:CRP-like cAMP-binding protein
MKHLKIEVCQVGTIVIPYSATQSNFYLILTGRVAQYNKLDKQYEQVREFTSGTTFGENGIIGDIHKEEYRTLEPTQLMVLEKNVFEIVLSNARKEKFEEQYSFLNSVSLFDNISDHIVSHLASIGLTKKFAPNTILAKQGDRPRGFYIIHTGSAKLLRNLNVRVLEGVVDRIVQIDEVESGDLICDYAFLYQEPLEYSVLCSMPLVAYFFDKDDFKPPYHTYLNDIKMISRKIPDDNQLSQNFIQKISWKKFKNKLFGSLDIRKRKISNKNPSRHQNVKLPPLKIARNLSV